MQKVRIAAIVGLDYGVTPVYTTGKALRGVMLMESLYVNPKPFFMV